MLIGIGHGLQWLLSTEDQRVGRGWCEVSGQSTGDSDSPTKNSPFAVHPLRALYIWSNAIAIPMFAMLSGRVSRSLAASCTAEASDERRASVPGRIKKTFEQLLVPFFTFQLLACLVEAASPALSDALAPHPPPTASFTSNDDDEIESDILSLACPDVSQTSIESNALNFWTPHLSWYLLALASWRAVVPVAAQMQPGAALALALALGVGVGISNVGYSVGFFLKFGTMWGNFPYFIGGVFLLGDEVYFAFRDDWGTTGRRLIALLVTLTTIVITCASLANGNMCFDQWQWEAWKSAPYGDYLFVDVDTTTSGTRGWHLTQSLAAPAFRLATYFGSVFVGAAFLACLPRTEIPFVTSLGSKTMYGYLLHAPALLGALAVGGVFAIASSDEGLSSMQFVWLGVVVPAVVTTVTMTAPFVFLFKWLCEPAFGNWLWREPEPPSTPTSQRSFDSSR